MQIGRGGRFESHTVAIFLLFVFHNFFPPRFLVLLYCIAVKLHSFSHVVLKVIFYLCLLELF